MSKTRKPPEMDKPTKRNKSPTPKHIPVPLQATVLRDITIAGQYQFAKDQQVYLKRKVIKERDPSMPDTYIKEVKRYIGKDTDGCPMCEVRTVEAINLDETQTLIFIGIGGGTGKGETKVDKYNKWYTLSKEQEECFLINQLF